MLLPLRQLVYNFKYSTIIWQGHHSLHHTNCGKIWDVSQSLLIEGLCAFDSVYKCLGNYFFKESGLLLFSCFPSWVIELNRDCTGDLQIQHYWLFIFSLMSQLWFFFFDDEISKVGTCSYERSWPWMLCHLLTWPNNFMSFLISNSFLVSCNIIHS